MFGHIFKIFGHISSLCLLKFQNAGGLNNTDMNVKGAWKKGVTGRNVVITILDDGIERDHEDLKENYVSCRGYFVMLKFFYIFIT